MNINILYTDKGNSRHEFSILNEYSNMHDDPNVSFVVKAVEF